MGGLSPDDRAEGDDRLDALGSREVPGREGELERSRHPYHGRVRHPVPGENPERALEQPVREAGVEAGGHDADPRSGDFVFSFDDVVGGHARRAPLRSVPVSVVVASRYVPRRLAPAGPGSALDVLDDLEPEPGQAVNPLRGAQHPHPPHAEIEQDPGPHPIRAKVFVRLARNSVLALVEAHHRLERTDEVLRALVPAEHHHHPRPFPGHAVHGVAERPPGVAALRVHEVAEGVPGHGLG